MLALLLAACGADPVPTAPGAPVWLEARKVDAGSAVRLHGPAGAELPAVEGLTSRVVDVGEAGTTWEVEGKPGSYVMDVPTSQGPPVRVFFDIGVEGPSGGAMDDLAGLPEPEPPRWPWILGGAAALGAVGGLAAWAWKRHRPIPPPPPPEPADVVARREWAALRARGDLAPEALALELSAVYRRYLDAVETWPATSRTTREILDNLAGELTALDLDRARRLLGAMDIVKFSERETHATIFTALDADFDELLRVRAPPSLRAGPTDRRAPSRP